MDYVSAENSIENRERIRNFHIKTILTWLEACTCILFLRQTTRGSDRETESLRTSSARRQEH